MTALIVWDACGAVGMEGEHRQPWNGAFLLPVLQFPIFQLEKSTGHCPSLGICPQELTVDGREGCPGAGDNVNV